MKLLIADDGKHLNFAPLTLTRPVAELRLGLMTISERWSLYLKPTAIGFETEAYLSAKYPDLDADVVVNASVIPDSVIATEIADLKEDSSLMFGEIWIAKKGEGAKSIDTKSIPVILNKRWDLYMNNEELINRDFDLLTKGRVSQKLSPTNTLIGDHSRLFIEEGAVIEASVLNVKDGPVYIAKDAEVMEGSMIRGPFGLLEHATIKMGAKIYGGTTIGPHCKVGGEVSNSIFYAYSNKGHDGFVGNSLIGEWCNLGADTNTSNLKNNYGKVKTFDFREKRLVQTDVTFMGLSMGDHSKASINTMFNTASTTGVFTNIFQAGFPDKFLPSFSWGTKDVVFDFDKALEVGNAMMARRGAELSKEDVAIFHFLFDQK